MKITDLGMLTIVAMVVVLIGVGSASADDMGSMDMGGMTHQMVPNESEATGSMDRMMSSEMMEHDPMMAAHMGYTPVRPKKEGDQQRADQMVSTLQTALAKYKDYRIAEADGYKPWHPEMKQPIVHFTKWSYGLKAAFVFNPAEPTSLLYQRTPEGGYELVGAMYTAPKRASDEQLDKRVPLSIARWHKHLEFVHSEKGHRSLDDRLEEIRNGLDRHQAGLRRGRWSFLSATLRLDGARLSVGERSADGMGALIRARCALYPFPG